MIRKRTSMLMLGTLLVLGACSPTIDEEPNLTNPSETENLGEEVKNPETDMDSNPEVIEQTSEEILNEVKAAIKTDVEVKLPEDVLTSEGYLTAATSSDANKYEVNFYVTNVPVTVNDPLLQDAHPYMIVNGTKFDSADAAKAKINYEPLADGAQKADLGSGITGYMDAGAGSVFLTWHKGRWSFSTRNHNDAKGSEEMIALAQQIVSKLESQSLPNPHDIGAGMFDMNSNGAAANSIIWQDGETVYEIFTGDPLLLIDTITGYLGR